MRDCRNCAGRHKLESEVLLTSKELIEALMYVIANRDDEEAQENLREAQIAHFKASGEAFCAGENAQLTKKGAKNEDF